MSPSRHLEPLRAAIVGVVALAAPATAQPVVIVRAEARIELHVEHEADVLTVHGRLLDDLGEPLTRRTVVVGIHRPDGRTLRTERRRTDAEGRFSFTTPGGAERYTLTASYEGDEFHPPLSVERPADLTRAPTRLTLAVDGALDLDVASHAVEVHASSRRGGAGLPIVLFDELGRELASGVTDAQGDLRLSIASRSLGGPGAGRWVARTEGDDQRADARVETPIIRYRTATLTLEASPSSTGPEGKVVFSGTLRTTSGPLANEAVGLFAGDAHLATALTGPDGRFEVAIDSRSLAQGRVTVRARFESDGPGVPSAQSESVPIEVLSGARSVWGWLAVPLCVSLLVLVWLRRRAPPAGTSAPLEAEPIGVITGPSGRRAPPRHRISGHLEGVQGAPLRGRVRATATGAHGEILAECDDSGAFELELPTGRWHLSFEAPRHAPAECAVDIPHRGSLEGLRVRLETWRAQALAVLRERFTASGRSLDRWSKTTVHSLRDDTELADTAAEVEVSYYGPIEPDGGRITQLRSGDRPPP